MGLFTPDKYTFKVFETAQQVTDFLTSMVDNGDGNCKVVWCGDHFIVFYIS